MLRRIWSENSWIPPLFAAASVIVTFIGLGWEWGLGLVGLILLVTIFALWNSLQRATESDVEADSDLGDAQHGKPEQVLRTSETEKEDQPDASGVDIEQADDESSQSDQFEFPVHLQIWIAARDGDLVKVRELSEPWILEVDGVVHETVRRKAFQLRMLALAGQTTALSELQALADEHPAEPMPVSNLAQLFQDLGEPRSGASAIRERLTAILPEDQPGLVAIEAELWRAAGEPGKAVEVVTQTLGSQQIAGSDEARLLAQRGLALYETNRHLLAFVDLERALELNPGDTDLRFKLAWRYSEQGWEAVAAAHYKVLGQDPKPNATALNNLGWSYERLGLSGMAAKTYHRAMEHGSGRAAGNYALLALDAGLLNQARTYVDRGLELDKTDDQVGRAVARLAERETSEEQAADELDEAGRDSRRIVAALQDSDAAVPTGRWVLVPGGFVEFDGDESWSQGTNDPTKVTVFAADEVGPMTLRWVEGELSGFEGPVRIKGDFLEGVMIDSANGRVRTILARRSASPPLPADTPDQDPASEENGQ